MTSSCLSQPNQRETTLPTSPSPLPLPLPLPLPFPLTFTHPFSSWQAILNYFTSFLPSSNPDPFTTHSSSTLITNLKENKEKELSWSTLIQLLETLADEAKLNPLFSSTVPPCLIPLLSQLYLLDPLPNRSTPLDCPSSSSTTPEKSHYPILRLLTNVLAHHPPHRWTFLHFLQSPPSSSSSSSFCSERHLLSTFASFHLPASSSASSSSSTTVLMKGMLAVLLNFSVHFPPGQLYLLQQHWLVHLLTWATSIQDLDTLVILVHLISVLLQTEASTSSLDENENEHHSPCVSVEEHERNHEDVHDHDPQKEKETVPLDASLALDFFLASPVHGMDTLASLLKPHPTHLPLVSAIMEVCSLFVSHPAALTSMYHSSLPVTLLETLDTLVSTTLTTLFPSSSLSNRKEDEENEAEEEKEEKEQLMDLFVSMTHVLITLSQQDEVHDPVDVSTSSSLFTPRSVQRLVKFLDLVAHPPPPLQPSHQRGWSSSWRFKVLKEIGICSTICLANFTRHDRRVHSLLSTHPVLEPLYSLLTVSNDEQSVVGTELKVASSALLRHLALPLSFRSTLGSMFLKSPFFELLHLPIPDFILNTLIFIRYCCSEVKNVQIIVLELGKDTLALIQSCFNRYSTTPSIACEVGRVFNTMLQTVLLASSDHPEATSCFSTLLDATYLASIWSIFQTPYVSVYSEVFQTFLDLSEGLLLPYPSQNSSTLTKFNALYQQHLRRCFPTCWVTWFHRLWTLTPPKTVDHSSSSSSLSPPLHHAKMVLWIGKMIQTFPELKPHFQDAFTSLPASCHEVSEGPFYEAYVSLKHLLIDPPSL